MESSNDKKVMIGEKGVMLLGDAQTHRASHLITGG